MISGIPDVGFGYQGTRIRMHWVGASIGPHDMVRESQLEVWLAKPSSEPQGTTADAILDVIGMSYGYVNTASAMLRMDIHRG